MTSFDAKWAAEVSAACDLVFAAADVGFVRHAADDGSPDAPVGAILWEADPARFAARYPDSGVVESYGTEHWDGVGCIDYWVYVHADEGLCSLSVEGWNLPEILVKVRGQGARDGMQVAAVFARILAVEWPRPR